MSGGKGAELKPEDQGHERRKPTKDTEKGLSRHGSQQRGHLKEEEFVQQRPREQRLGSTRVDVGL